LHPEAEPRATDARKAQLTEAFQIFKQIKFNILRVRQAVIVGVAGADQVRSVKHRALAPRLLRQPLGKLASEWGQRFARRNKTSP
jgi:predicted metal-binding membrane protein